MQPKQPDTHMSTYLADLLTWAAHNGMEINTSKTKEMLLGPLATTNLPLLTISSQTIERVTSFKLLGVHLDSSLAWSTHINHIIKRQPPGCTFSSNSKELVCPTLTYCISI